MFINDCFGFGGGDGFQEGVKVGLDGGVVFGFHGVADCFDGQLEGFECAGLGRFHDPDFFLGIYKRRDGMEIDYLG